MHTHPGAGDRCNGFRRRCFPRVSSARSLLVGLVAILAVTFAMPVLESAAQDVASPISQTGENIEGVTEATAEALANRAGKGFLLRTPGVAITMSGGRRRYQSSREATAWEGYETLRTLTRIILLSSGLTSYSTTTRKAKIGSLVLTCNTLGGNGTASG